MQDWEGGVRVNGFVSGGFISTQAPSRVGSRLEGLVHVCDWYATFTALAGASVTDARAQRAGLPPPDSLNLWPYLSGKVEVSPRSGFHMSKNAILDGHLKLLTGDVKHACWAGPHFPNGTGDPTCNEVARCGDGGCLYDVFADPGEYVDLAADPAHAADLARLQKLLGSANTKLFSPDRGAPDTRACQQVVKNGGFWAPFAP